MSHHIVKKIEIMEDGKVFITGADNNVSPRTPRRWECTYLDRFPAIEEKKISIMEAYEAGTFQGGSNMFTRALKVLRHMPEYKAFDWRAPWGEEYELANSNRENKKAEFKELLKKAMNTQLPRTKYIIVKPGFSDTTLYFNYRKGAHFCRWYSERSKATTYHFKEDAEGIIKSFTNSEGWNVIVA